MRIAFFTDTFLPQVNGVATSIARFAEELGKRGHKVLIICPAPRGKERRWKAKNVRVVDLPSIPAVLYADFRLSPFVGLPRTLSAIRSFKPDVIHFHTTLAIAVDALLAAKFFGKPLIGTNHVLLSKTHNEYLSFLTSNKFLRGYLSRAALAYAFAFYSTCDLSIAPSKLLISELRKSGYRQKIDYLPNAVPLPAKTRITAAQHKTFWSRYNLRERVLIHVGRLSKEKRVDQVLQAFSRVCHARKDVSLMVIGDGPDRVRLEKLAKKLGIAGATVFTGFIAPDKLYHSGMLSTGDAFVTASAMESQGMAVIEAMAFGLPIVAVGEGALPEVIGKAGILVKKGRTGEMSEAMLRILNNKPLAKKLRKAALVQFAEFSIESTTDKLLDLYKEAIANYHLISRSTIRRAHV